jgi:ankyrin repeat protein
MMVAAQYGHKSIVRLFVEARAQMDLQNLDGETALIVAVCMGHLEIIELLVVKGNASLHSVRMDMLYSEVALLYLVS